MYIHILLDIYTPLYPTLVFLQASNSLFTMSVFYGVLGLVTHIGIGEN